MRRGRGRGGFELEISLISLLVETVLEFFIEGQEAAYRPGDFNPNFITFFRHKKTSNMSPGTKRQETAFYRAPPPSPGHLVQTAPVSPPCKRGPGLPHPDRSSRGLSPNQASGRTPLPFHPGPPPLASPPHPPASSFSTFPSNSSLI